MPYLGKSPSFGVRQRYQYTATAGQTTFSGTDLGNLTLTYTDNNFVDVFQNGVLLKGGGTDYTATSGTSVVLGTGATADDVIEIIVYDAFSAANFYSRTDSDSRYLSAAKGIDDQTSSNDDQLTITDTAVVINEDSDDVDFRVESNGQTHALFVDAGNDHVNINTDSDLGSTLNINGEVTIANANSGIIMVENAADAFGSNFTMRKSRNTTLNAHTVVQDDDVTGNINFQASDGDEFLSTASISSAVDGTPGNNDMPGRLVFSVTADGASSPTQAMMIEEDGHITIKQGDNQGSNRLLVTEDNNNNALMVRSTNASFDQKTIFAGTNRASSSGFIVMDLFANNTSDIIFRVRGDGEVGADGSFSGGGVDYAEYFEWKDGNPSNEDRVGLSVKLDGNKIVLSSDSDNASDIIGVISGKPAVEGGAADLKWNSKFLVDDFNRYIWEEYTATEWTEIKIVKGVKQENYFSYETDRIPSDVTVPSDAKIVSADSNGEKLMRRKLNPDYDESKTYVPRRKRKEWNAVGLLGQLRIKKGQKTGANWIKMRDISDTVEEWLVR